MTGGGGVGKTQLAAAVFAQARDDGVELLVWANALSRESIVATYAQALARPNLMRSVAGRCGPTPSASWPGWGPPPDRG
jgi:hypothetical protein